MEVVGLVVGSALVATLVVALLLAVSWARAEITSRGWAQDNLRAAERETSKVEIARDSALAELVRARAERDAALVQAKVMVAAATVAREELMKHVREKLVGGSDRDVAAEVDRLLSTALPSVRPAGAPAGGDKGGA